MMPWKDQLRLGWRMLRWAYWPPDQHAWANIASLIVLAAAIIAVSVQLWLGWLAALFLWYVIGHSGKKPARRGSPPDSTA